jgi:HSP20 family protein
MLARWQPLGGLRGEMNRLQEEMDRLYGRFANGVREYAPGVYPPLNLWEDDSNLYVEAELPGFDHSGLEMYVTGDNQLSIKGTRNAPEMEGGTWHRQERGYGSFGRLMDLPTAVDSHRVSAEFKDGVLTITLPKKEEAKPRRIEVKAG